MGSGVKRLKIGSSTTGDRNSNRKATATIAPAPGIHQRRGKRRIRMMSSAPPAAAKTAPKASLLTTSLAQPPQLWVDRPNSLSRFWAIAESGSVATATTRNRPAPVIAEPVRGRSPIRSAARLTRAGGRTAKATSTTPVSARLPSPRSRCVPT